MKRRIGRSDLWVNPVGLGCMSLPDDRARSTALIHEAIDAGADFFDTADLYGQGRNEELLGEALAHRRHQVVIATKVGHRFTPGQEGFWWDPKPEHVLTAVHESLRRLKTDYIDLYQMHGGTLDDPIEDLVEVLERLKGQGTIRAYGISSIRPNVIRRYVSVSHIDSVMMQYSLLDRRPEEEMLPFLHDAGISVIARGPVARGMLSQPVHDGQSPVSEYTAAEWETLQSQLQMRCDPHRTVSQLAISYTLAHPAVAVAIPGASRIEQVRDNMATLGAPPLSEEDLSALRACTHAGIYTSHR